MLVKPQQDCRRGKIMFTIKPRTTRKAQRAQINLVHTRTQRPHRDWDRTVFEHLLRRYGSAVDCCGSWGSGCSRPGYGTSLLEEVPLPHHRAARTYTGQGNKLLAGKNRTLCAPGPRKKEQWPHKRLTQTCLKVSRSRRQWPAAGLGALCVAVHAWDLLKEVPIIFITSSIVCPR